MPSIIGQGWAFPPRIDNQGGFALTDTFSELNQSIQIILMTSPGQRVMRPNFGSRLQELMFAPNNSQTAALAESYVAEALGMWEPRITVSEVHARVDPQRANCLTIEIVYEVKASHDKRSLVYPFYLIPGE